MTGIAAFNGKNLVSAKAGVSKALKKNYIVSDFSLQFKLPNILSVQVLAKKPVFALYNTATNQSALIGPEGETLSISSGTSLPRLFINQNLPKPGERVSANYLLYQVGEGDLQSGSLTVDLPGPIKVIFPLEGDRDVILGALKLIYAKTQGEGSRKFSQIDLRYKNPVLR